MSLLSELLPVFSASHWETHPSLKAIRYEYIVLSTSLMTSKFIPPNFASLSLFLSTHWLYMFRLHFAEESEVQHKTRTWVHQQLQDTSEFFQESWCGEGELISTQLRLSETFLGLFWRGGESGGRREERWVLYTKYNCPGSIGILLVNKAALPLTVTSLIVC